MNAKKVYVLNAKKRAAESVNIRKQGLIPVVLYGRGFATENLQVNSREFIKLFAEAGESSLIDLNLDEGKPTKVIVKEIQTDPINDSIIHVDLYKIRMDEPITAEVPFNFVGTAPAEKDLGGVIVKHIDSIEVKCLPGDLVHDITLDLSNLKTFEDTIGVGDLEKIAGIEFLVEADVQIVSVSEPRKIEEVVEEVSEEEAVAQVEKVSGEGEPEEGSEAESTDSKAEKPQEDKK